MARIVIVDAGIVGLSVARAALKRGHQAVILEQGSVRGLVVTHCDGQMFKFGPLMGERIVDMFDGAESAASLARWAAGH